MFKMIKSRWDKCSLDTKEKIKIWILIFLVSGEARLFFDYCIPAEIKADYGKSEVYSFNWLIHIAVVVPILYKLLGFLLWNRKGK